MAPTAPYSGVNTCNTRPAARRTQAENRPVRHFQFRKDHESIDPIIHTTELGTYTKSPILHNLVVNLQWHPLRCAPALHNGTRNPFFLPRTLPRTSADSRAPSGFPAVVSPGAAINPRMEKPVPQRPRKISMLKWSGNHSTDRRHFVVEADSTIVAQPLQSDEFQIRACYIDGPSITSIISW